MYAGSPKEFDLDEGLVKHSTFDLTCYLTSCKYMITFDF